MVPVPLPLQLSRSDIAPLVAGIGGIAAVNQNTGAWSRVSPAAERRDAGGAARLAYSGWESDMTKQPDRAIAHPGHRDPRLASPAYANSTAFPALADAAP